MGRTDSSGQDGQHYPRCNTYCRPGVHHLTDGIGLPHLHQTNLGAVCGECVSDHPATPTEETHPASPSCSPRSCGQNPSTEETAEQGAWVCGVCHEGGPAHDERGARRDCVFEPVWKPLVATSTEETSEVADEDRAALADAMSLAMLEASDGYVQAHDEQWKRAADALLASDWLRAHDAALTANAKAEVERLRHEMAYWKRLAESHGPCSCDTNPETTSGPEEDCPQHGRRVGEWIERGDTWQARAESAQVEVDDLRARLAKVEADLAARADHVSNLQTATRTDAYRLAGKAEGLRIGVNLLRAALANPDAAGEGEA